MLDRWVPKTATPIRAETCCEPKRGDDPSMGEPCPTSRNSWSVRKASRGVLRPLCTRTGLAMVLVGFLGGSAGHNGSEVWPVVATDATPHRTASALTTAVVGTRRVPSEATSERALPIPGPTAKPGSATSRCVPSPAASQHAAAPLRARCESPQEGVKWAGLEVPRQKTADNGSGASQIQPVTCPPDPSATADNPGSRGWIARQWWSGYESEHPLPAHRAVVGEASSPVDVFEPQPENPFHVQFVSGEAPGANLAEAEAVPTPDALEPITLHLDGVEVPKALEILSREGSVSILVAPGVTGRVTANLVGMSFDEALDAILRLCNLTAVRQKDVIFVHTLQQVPQVELGLQAFALDFLSPVDVLPGVQGLLSPMGKSFVLESSSDDNRRTRDVIVVEDLPEYVHRVQQYIEAIDQPPRQVLIEVHVLQIELDDDQRHGVNFDHAIHFMNNDVNLRVEGFANPAAPQAFFIDVDGANLEALVEMLKETTDAKTLASPKVLVLNGQEAHIQIGERLGYVVTTVTETAAMQDIKFLDVGVVLDVTPRISRDNQVILRVHPKVSSGRITPGGEGQPPLPEEETTEVETDVCLFDGRGMVIGGLIQETDSNVQGKIPLLGDLWLIGTLFQRRQIVKTRNEIIITLIPRVFPYLPDYDSQEQTETARAETPLLHGPLRRFPRPWEPRLPDTLLNPQAPRLPRVERPAYRGQ